MSSRDTERLAAEYFKGYISAVWALKTNLIHLLCVEVAVTGISKHKQTTEGSESVVCLASITTCNILHLPD